MDQHVDVLLCWSDRYTDKPDDTILQHEEVMRKNDGEAVWGKFFKKNAFPEETPLDRGESGVFEDAEYVDKLNSQATSGNTFLYVCNPNPLCFRLHRVRLAGIGRSEEIDGGLPPRTLAQGRAERLIPDYYFDDAGRLKYACRFWFHICGTTELNIFEELDAEDFSQLFDLSDLDSPQRITLCKPNFFPLPVRKEFYKNDPEPGLVYFDEYGEVDFRFIKDRVVRDALLERWHSVRNQRLQWHFRQAIQDIGSLVEGLIDARLNEKDFNWLQLKREKSMRKILEYAVDERVLDEDLREKAFEIWQARSPIHIIRQEKGNRVVAKDSIYTDEDVLDYLNRFYSVYTSIAENAKVIRF